MCNFSAMHCNNLFLEMISVVENFKKITQLQNFKSTLFQKTDIFISKPCGGDLVASLVASS